MEKRAEKAERADERKVTEIIESLNPDERAILQHLDNKNFKNIVEKSGFDETRALRALRFLENKKILELMVKEKKIVDLGDNGVVYLKNNLPERNLLNLLAEKQTLSLTEARKASGLSENEFQAALGALKKKAMVKLQADKVILNATREEIIKKSPEEQFLETLPLEFEKLEPEQKAAFDSLKNRKDIVRVVEEKEIKIEITDLGKEIVKADLSKVKEMIEVLTPEMIKSESWRGKKFRRYDIKSAVPEISGGKKHFVNQAIAYARAIWAEMGFEEMSGTLTQTAFWNFDALFTAQDHPVREMHDTFYIQNIKGKLPDRKIVASVKNAHEKGTQGSKGWQYKWKEEEAKRVVLRTHTTCLSANTLAKLASLKDKKSKLDKQGKFFAIGKCFRNETVDWSHAFEFNQTEGIVVDKNANFRHLLGYLKEFFKKMGHEKIRFRPSYFPYTEPSLEIDVFIPEKNKWLELGGAGILRPEVVVPLLGEWIPVLAWGPGFDRIIMDYYQIKDLREIYKNDIDQLRKIKFWMK